MSLEEMRELLNVRNTGEYSEIREKAFQIMAVENFHKLLVITEAAKEALEYEHLMCVEENVPYAPWIIRLSIVLEELERK